MEMMSDYRFMRSILFFDLPMMSDAEVRRYTRFRKYLINNGYIMMQYSIYSKIFPNRDTVKWHMQDLERNLPSDGSVMIMTVTEKQYQSIQNLVGSKKALDRKITSKRLLAF
jgi:CRISPR-associated protein Cas2